VNRASQYTAKHGIITTTTKTKESKRIFSISEHEINILGKYREWWLIEKSRNSWGRAERLFLQENGLPMHPDSVTDWLKKFCLKHSFKHFSPHALRHTNVSLLIAAGISIREVAARVGHARASTTSDLYAHSVKSAEVKASRVIPALLFEVGIC
jgi:integrase